MQRLGCDLEVEVDEITNGQLEVTQLFLADSSYFGEARTRIGEVFKSLHGHSKASKDQSVDGSRCDGDHLVVDAQLKYIAASGEVDGAGHGAKLVKTIAIFLD